MPDEEFESIDAIERHFGKLKKEAGDDEEKKRGLAVDEREAKADFRERAATQRELAAHRKTALAEIPEDFHEFVTGNTPEEIDASAKKVKERVDKLAKAAGAEGAKKFYGEPLGNGGGSPPPPRTSEESKWIDDFQKRFADPSANVTTGEISRYAELLGGAHLLHELSETSRIFKRNGITPELVAEHEAGTLKQVRPSRAGVSLPPRA